MNWTEPQAPNDKCSYNHVTCQTPLGEMLIDWKGWKDYPSYGVQLNGYYITTAYSLEESKEAAENFIKEKANELNNFLNNE